jgi:hypothetical protein
MALANDKMRKICGRFGEIKRAQTRPASGMGYGYAIIYQRQKNRITQETSQGKDGKK